MKKEVSVLSFLLALAMLLSACTENGTARLENAMKNYSQTITEGVPADLRLTIYYIPQFILFRFPLSIDRMIGLDDVTIIAVDSDKLEEHWEALRSLDAAALLPVKEETYVDARLYYVFENDDGKLLEVVVNGWGGSAFVNGVEVEQDLVLYEVVKPYLSEEDRSIWDSDYGFSD